MLKPKELQRGDACPTCGDDLHAAYVPTDKEFERFHDRENPGHLPFRADTANPDQRAELGELFRCDRCGYQTRFPAEHSSGERGASDRSTETDDHGESGGADETTRGSSAATSGRAGATSGSGRRR